MLGNVFCVAVHSAGSAVAATAGCGGCGGAAEGAGASADTDGQYDPREGRRVGTP